MGMKLGLCKLCLQEKLLIEQSHIIPNFYYNHLGLKKNKRKEFHSVNYTEGWKIPKQTGEFEKYILCQNCDNEIIGGYEKYGKSIFIDGECSFLPVLETDDAEIKYGGYSGLDYKNFKLFFLSILWRMSITNREFFKYVKLQPNQEEKLRVMILTGNPGKEYEYPILFYQLDAATFKVQSMVTQPHPRTDYIHLQIGRMQINYFLSTTKHHPSAKYGIKKNGVLHITMLERELSLKQLQSYIPEWVVQLHTPKYN